MSSRFSGASQSNRRIAVKTPLPDNQLLFRQMGVTEELSRLFQMDLTLLSISSDINLDDLLGKNVTVGIQRPDGGMRFFNGFASSAAFGGTEGDFFRYDLVLRPWFWFLTRTSDCRIFQEKTVPEIIEEVLGDQGFSDYENKLSGSYRTWEYCVQYRESDFNFLSRLMEQEGIYYFFRHENGRHVLVLCDGIGSHTTVPGGYATIPFYPADGNRRRRDRDHFWHWSASRQLQSGTYALNDFNFKTPFADLQVKSTVSNPHAQADYEVYDYPGEYTERGEGEAYSKARIEETQQPHQLVAGQGDAAGVETGALFTLQGHGRDDQNIEYIIVSAQHQLRQGGYQANSSEDDDEYQVSIQAMDSKLTYRAQRSTPKPTVQGPQTAMVVGKQGEEIWTDQYGRVKVQFHWDRYSKGDETSSCWIRVAQIWAGKNWGGMFIPRIGHEVIVEFLEGDPDRPIITGRVYNGAAKPPYELPAEATKSTIKSNSSKGGGGFNELRFEDKKGAEELYIHAEKNHTNITKNDRSENVGNNRSLQVGNNKNESVGNDKQINIGGMHNETIKKDAGITITEGNYTHTVATGTETRTTEQKISIESKSSEIYVKANTSITLEVGESKLVMLSNGQIKLSGVDIAINGKSAIAEKAPNIVSSAPVSHTITGGAVSSIAGATNTVIGAIVTLNPGPASMGGGSGDDSQETDEEERERLEDMLNARGMADDTYDDTANPEKLKDVDQMKERLDQSRLEKLFSSDELGKMGLVIDQGTLKDSASGFAAAIYEMKDGSYTIAFRGSHTPGLNSEAAKDWLGTNFLSTAGVETAQFEKANALTAELITKKGIENVQVTGHSLGGGLANYAALSNGVPSTTFNSKGTTWRERVEVWLKGKDLNLEADRLITNYQMEGDPLTKRQEAIPYSPMTEAPGKNYKFSAVGPPLINPKTNQERNQHDLEYFKESGETRIKELDGD